MRTRNKTNVAAVNAQLKYLRNPDPPAHLDTLPDSDAQTGVTAVPVDDLYLDAAMQMRDEIDPAVVEEYAELYQQGVELPPIKVYFTGEEPYFVVDGFHRVLAAQKAGMSELMCEIVRGTRREALYAATSANGAHGLRRSDKTKALAVDTLLRDDEWTKMSDRAIARHVQVSHVFVAKRREALGRASKTRTFERGGKTHEMRVKPHPPAQEKPHPQPPLHNGEGELSAAAKAEQYWRKAFNSFEEATRRCLWNYYRPNRAAENGWVPDNNPDDFPGEAEFLAELVAEDWLEANDGGTHHRITADGCGYIGQPRPMWMNLEMKRDLDAWNRGETVGATAQGDLTPQPPLHNGEGALDAAEQPSAPAPSEYRLGKTHREQAEAGELTWALQGLINRCTRLSEYGWAAEIGQAAEGWLAVVKRVAGK